MTDPYLQTVIAVTAEVLDMEAAALSADITAEDLGRASGDLDFDFYEIIEESAERVGASADAIFKTMPDAARDETLSGRQLLAPFSSRAQETLARLNQPSPRDTLGSIAKSVEAGRYVPSGVTKPAGFEPLDKTTAAMRIATLPVTAFSGVVLLEVFGPVCQPLCQACTIPAAWELPLYATGFALLLLAVRIGPALWAMRARGMPRQSAVLVQNG